MEIVDDANWVCRTQLLREYVKIQTDNDGKLQNTI